MHAAFVLLPSGSAAFLLTKYVCVRMGSCGAGPSLWKYVQYELPILTRYVMVHRAAIALEVVDPSAMYNHMYLPPIYRPSKPLANI